VVAAPEEELRAAIRRVYSLGALTAENVIAGLAKGELNRPLEELALDDLVSLAHEAPVIKLVNLLLPLWGELGRQDSDRFHCGVDLFGSVVVVG
jgi:hypothetical protein